jgi:hypothetical protein
MRKNNIIWRFSVLRGGFRKQTRYTDFGLFENVGVWKIV